jgi:hypothetical protein
MSTTRGRDIYASHDSLIHGAIWSSSKHQHFMLQPQDIWLTILKQLGSYMRKHKDDQEIIAKWDNYEGKDVGPDLLFANLDSWTEMQFIIRNKTTWLRDWVKPDFSTVSAFEQWSEGMMAKAFIMASFSSPQSSSALQEEATSFQCKNGMPSVTLLGTQLDWKTLVGKLDRLWEFGEEPKRYGQMLRPILSRFVASFEKANDPAIRLFWSEMISTIARQKICSTTDLITGWINAFRYWDAKGNLVYDFTEPAPREVLQLDDIGYPQRHLLDIPISHSWLGMCLAGDAPGYALTETLLGMLAIGIKKGVPTDYSRALLLANLTLPTTVLESHHSILQPLPGWMLQISGDNAKV